MAEVVKRALLAQLYAVRTQIDAAIELLTSEAPPPQEAACSHPEEKRTSCSTMGHPRFYCGACGQLIEQEQPSEVSEG